MTYGYDASFRIASQKVNGASQATYSYDGDDLLAGVTLAGASSSLAITRDTATQRAGLVTATSLGGVSDERAYSDFGEPSSYTARWAGSPIYAVSYDARDGLGRITGKTETIGGTTTVYEYGYEASGRLDTVRQNGVLVSDYAYDANGNRTAAPNLTGTALYDDQDRLLAYGARIPLIRRAASRARTRRAHDGSPAEEGDPHPLGDIGRARLRGLCVVSCATGADRALGLWRHALWRRGRG